jgi:hypothetical protein
LTPLSERDPKPSILTTVSQTEAHVLLTTTTGICGTQKDKNTRREDVIGSEAEAGSFERRSREEMVALKYATGVRGIAWSLRD